MPTDGVTEDLRFYHREEKEQNRGLDFTWFMGEMDKRLTVPKEMFQKCAVCGLDWGMCTHAANNPVDVDNEVMALVYEKVGLPVPVYPPCWADFWYACKDIYHKRRRQP